MFVLDHRCCILALTAAAAAAAISPVCQNKTVLCASYIIYCNYTLEKTTVSIDKHDTTATKEYVMGIIPACFHETQLVDAKMLMLMLLLLLTRKVWRCNSMWRKHDR